MRKIVSVFISLALIICMSGCGGKNAPAPIGPGSSFVTIEDMMPVKTDFASGPEWNGKAEPTHENGKWAQAYDVIESLAEMAAVYDDTTPVYTYTLACHESENSAIAEFLTAWADAVTVVTNGAVDFDIGYSGAHSSSATALDDMMNGSVDFVWTLPGYFEDHFPLSNVIQNPTLGISNASVGSKVMWELYKTNADVQSEYREEGEVLFLWAGCPTPLSYKGDKEIKSLSQISGNIRINDGPSQIFVEEVGATVLNCPVNDINTNISIGLLTYLGTDWQGIKSYALSETGTVNYYMDINLGCSAYALLCSHDTWSYIPLQYREAIKSVSGDYLMNIVDIWNYWEALGRYSAAQSEGVIFKPNSEFAAELRTVYDAVTLRWITENGEIAQSVYDQTVELVKQYG